MRAVPISDELLSEINLWQWFKLRKILDGPVTVTESIFVVSWHIFVGLYIFSVLTHMSTITPLDVKESVTALVDVLFGTAGAGLDVVLPSFAIFMALGQTKNVSYLATIEDEDPKINYLKKTAFPFVYASLISLSLLFVAIFLKLMARCFFGLLSGGHYWTFSLLFYSMYISGLGLLLLGCVLKDFIFNLVHIIMFIIINAPKEGTDNINTRA
jgi:hypothetical protein